MDLSTDADTFILEAMSASGEKILVNPRFAPRAASTMRDSWKIAATSFRIDMKQVGARGV